jgi:hypothetical protein
MEQRCNDSDRRKLKNSEKNLSQSHCTDLGSNPGRHSKIPATNHVSCDTASPLSDFVLGQSNPVYISTIYFPKNYFNIILPSVFQILLITGLKT